MATWVINNVHMHLGALQTSQNRGQNLSHKESNGTSSQLPQQLSEEENVHVQRAAVCCLATYYSSEEAKKIFVKHGWLQFKEAYVCPQPQPDEEARRQAFLVARATDSDGWQSIYVAFRGNSNFAEVFSEVCEPSNIKLFQESLLRYDSSKVQGSFHKKFCDRLNNFVPPLDRLLDFCKSLVINSSDSSTGQQGLTRARTRLIFCGHSFGGAISHLAALIYLLSIFGSKDEVSKHQTKGKLYMSIAFGAPLVFDEQAVRFLNKDFPVAGRLLTFVKASDPIPSLLAGFSASNEKHFHELNLKNSESLEAVGKLLVEQKSSAVKNSSLEQIPDAPTTVTEIVAKLAMPSATTTVPVTKPPASRKSTLGTRKRDSIRQFIRVAIHGGRQRAHLQADIRKGRYESVRVRKTIGGERSMRKNDSGERWFCPLGIYMKLSFQHKKARKERMEPQQISHSDFKLKKKNIKAHAMSSYFHPLVESLPGTNVQKSIANVEQGPTPQVDRADIIILRGDKPQKLTGARIVVRGRNLSLALEKNCQVTSFPNRWKLQAADVNTLIFETIRMSEPNGITQEELLDLSKPGFRNIVSSISIETAFGGTGKTHPIVLKDFANDSRVIDGLKHAVGKALILTDTDGPDGQPCRKIVQHLHKAAAVVHLKEYLPAVFSAVSERAPNGTVLEEKTLLEPTFISRLSYELCRRPLTLTLEPERAREIKRVIQHNRTQPLEFFGNSGNHLVGNDQDTNLTLDDLFYTSLVLKSEGPSLLDNQIELDSYDRILECLHALVLPDSDRSLAPDGPMQSSGKMRWAEAELYEVMKGYHTGKTEEVNKDLLMKNWPPGMTPMTRELILQRLELIYELTSAYTIAKEQRLLALLGPEDAGKRQLGKLLRCNDEKKTTPAAGLTLLQRSKVKSYRLGENLLAIDFPSAGSKAPGSLTYLSTIWEPFERLPDRCIVVVPFEGDVTESSQELPRLAARKLCPSVMLLVNKVNSILRGPADAKIWKQYSPKDMISLQKRYMKTGGGVTLRDVHLCCLEDEHDLPVGEKLSLEERNVLFSAAVVGKIRDWLSLPSSQSSAIATLSTSVTPTRSDSPQSGRKDDDVKASKTSSKTMSSGAASVINSTEKDPKGMPPTSSSSALLMGRSPASSKRSSSRRDGNLIPKPLNTKPDSGTLTGLMINSSKQDLFEIDDCGTQFSSPLIRSPRYAEPGSSSQGKTFSSSIVLDDLPAAGTTVSSAPAPKSTKKTVSLTLNKPDNTRNRRHTLEDPCSRSSFPLAFSSASPHHSSFKDAADQIPEPLHTLTTSVVRTGNEFSLKSSGSANRSPGSKKSSFQHHHLVMSGTNYAELWNSNSKVSRDPYAKTHYRSSGPSSLNTSRNDDRGQFAHHHQQISRPAITMQAKTAAQQVSTTAGQSASKRKTKSVHSIPHHWIP